MSLKQQDEKQRMQEKEIGNQRSRREDIPLLRGEAPYTDDIQREGMLYMSIIRSPYGHARIDSIDVSAVERRDDVAVYTAADIEQSEGSGLIPTTLSLHGLEDPDKPARARKPLTVPDRPLLATDKVHYMGEPVAVAVAQDRYSAQDTAELVDVEYDLLDAVVEPDAGTQDAPQIHDEVESNLAFDWEIGDAAGVDDAFANADHTVQVDIGNQRISPTPLEPRAVLAEFDTGSHELTVHMGTQKPHAVRTMLSEALAIPEESVRVIAPEVGGGFGCKSKFYSAEALTVWCSIQEGQPVKWKATRSESHLSDIHGRGRTITGKLAFDDDGTIQGLQVHSIANLGAYVSNAAPGTRTGSFVDIISGQYEIPKLHCRVKGVLTNTSPVDAYRGSSRPQGVLIVEQLVSRAADSLGVDPAEFRRKNFIPPEAFPYHTAHGFVYDSGAYEDALDRALDLANYDRVRDRQETLREEGRYLGVGFSCSIDNAGTSSSDSAYIALKPDGSVIARCGTADQGQGHRTTFAQVVADLLGVSFNDIEMTVGDSGGVPVGGGASGSRSVVVCGEVLREAAAAVIKKARTVAARELDVPEDDLEFEDGEFLSGDTSIHIKEVAQIAHDNTVTTDLKAIVEDSTPATYPFGTHIAVVEVNVTTGDVEVEDYIAVDDCGVQINPTLVEGQIIGGVIQGIGQALYENAVYDDNGTLVTGTLQDYALPRAHRMPSITTDYTETPSPFNELGVKGTGEAGATAAPAAVANAVVDALAPFDVPQFDLPITPEDVWQATADYDES